MTPAGSVLGEERPGPGAGRPSRERILEAATLLFAKNGYEGTSTRAIGAAAGANIAMIAYHFSDKEGLYTEVLRTTHERLLALVVREELAVTRHEAVQRGEVVAVSHAVKNVEQVDGGRGRQ